MHIIIEISSYILLMEPSPQIYQFNMILSNGVRIKKTIKHINLIHLHITQYGINNISKIIFYFIHSALSSNNIHNITLQYTPSHRKFSIIYYHYFNWINQLYIISPMQQYTDLCILYQLLSTNENLNQSLLPHIII